MAELEFYDVKSKDKFKTTNFEVREKSGKFFAVTKSPTGDYECWKIISRVQAEEFKGQQLDKAA